MVDLIKCSSAEMEVVAQVDETSRRIWVLQYKAKDPAVLGRFLKEQARLRGLEKIILPARVKDRDGMEDAGFIEEGFIPGYLDGEDAHFMAIFPSAERLASPSREKEQEMIVDIQTRSTKKYKPLPAGFSIREGTKQDAVQMADLFRQVFSSYPSPVFDPVYLVKSMDRGDIYMVAHHGPKIAGVAAAEICQDQRRAELTNCATSPCYQGRGLNTLLLAQVENICLARGICCLYSLARASSYGMNQVLHRLDYAYGGTLINNCHIAGRYENMNIWVKVNNQMNIRLTGSHYNFSGNLNNNIKLYE